MIVRCIPCESRTSSGTHKNKRLTHPGGAFVFVLCLTHVLLSGRQRADTPPVRGSAFHLGRHVAAEANFPHPSDAEMLRRVAPAGAKVGHRQTGFSENLSTPSPTCRAGRCD